MRKLLFILPLLFLFLVNISHAQKIGLGGTVGFNLSTHSNDFSYKFQDTKLDFTPELKEGYNIGLVYRQILSNNFRIQVEPTLIQMGGSYNDTFTFNDFEFESQSRTDLAYLQLPFVFQLTTTPPDREEFSKPWAETTYHLSSGFYGGYLIDATFSGTNRGAPLGIEFENNFTNDVTKRYNTYEAGVIIGGGLEYGLDTKVGIELQALLGLMGFPDNSDERFDPKNIAATFDIYFLF